MDIHISSCNRYVSHLVRNTNAKNRSGQKWNGNKCNGNWLNSGKKLKKQNYLRESKIKNKSQDDQGRMDSNNNFIRDIEYQENYEQNKNEIKKEVKKVREKVLKWKT